MAASGIEKLHPSWIEPLDSAELHLLEYLINCDSFVRWDYWLAMPTWTAREFAALKMQIDPKTLDNLSNRDPKYGAIPQRILEWQALIERNCKHQFPDQALTPVAWVEWAHSMNYPLPDRFAALVQPADAAAAPPQPESGPRSKKDNYDPLLQQLANKIATSWDEPRPINKAGIAKKVRDTLQKMNSPRASLDVPTIEKRIRASEWKRLMSRK
jgi:hypothetical protein